MCKLRLNERFFYLAGSTSTMINSKKFIAVDMFQSSVHNMKTKPPAMEANVES